MMIYQAIDKKSANLSSLISNQPHSLKDLFLEMLAKVSFLF